MPVPLDEFPVHQVPMSMAYVASSDRNCYDRCYVNAHDRTGELFVVTGLGVYPNLGVKDAYLTVMRHGRQSTIRMSDALDADRMAQTVGGRYRIEVSQPLRRVRVVCEAGEEGIGADFHWSGSFPAVDESLHVLRQNERVIVEGCRFAQVGTIEGVVSVDGEDTQLDAAVTVGTRDRSWGIRPVGEAEPAGRAAGEPAGRAAGEPADGWGFWWTYAPLRFDDFALVLIAQEDGQGNRTAADALKVFPFGSGRPPEVLGWADFDISYEPGTRFPTGATITVSGRGAPVVVEVSTLGHVLLNAGPGYAGDPTWSHGQWRGRGFVERLDVDLADPALAGQRAFAVIDHVARATCEGQTGYGLFEHGTFGAHAPSGFSGWESVAQ